MNHHKNAEQHILKSIDSCGHEGASYFTPCETDKEKAAFSYGRFMAEYGWLVERKGLHIAVTEWLQGLALNIAYNNHEILNLAREWGNLPEKTTEEQEDKFLSRYWSYMAMRLHSLWHRNGVI